MTNHSQNSDRLQAAIHEAKSNPASSEALYRAAYLIADLLSLDEELCGLGEQFINQALLIEPNNPRFLWTKGYLLQRKANLIRQRAIDCFRQAVELEPDMKKNHYQFIAAHRSSGNLNEAVSYYLDQIKAQPRLAMNYSYLAFAYYMAQQFAEAVSAADQGLSLDSSIADLYYVRGEALLSQNRDEEALSDFEQCLHLDPSFIDVRFTLAAYYERQDRITEAINQWQQIITVCEAEGEKMDEETLDSFRANLARLKAQID